ncbi:MAG: S8 family serine peptidase [Chloroflexi bacterium]|nr:S8 family serine peptidase [Chloroflexota bacterium]
MAPNFPSYNNRLRPKRAFIGVAALALCLTALISLATPPAALAVPTAPDAELLALIDKVNQFGAVRVIVGLDLAFTPEGELAGSQAVQSQRQAIQTAQNQVWHQLSDFNSELNAVFKRIPYMAVTVDAAALNQLMRLPEVTSIQEDKLSAPTLASSIPVIGADTAWANGHVGAGQAIAILDTGVDKTHGFFSGGKVVSEACYSSTGNSPSEGAFFSVCPGGAPESTAPGSGIDCVAAAAGYSDAQSDCRHGTHVAGIAAGNDGLGPDIGVAKEADIIAIQVFTVFENYNGAYSWDSDQIKGLERVLELNAEFDIAAVNMSLGGSALYSYSCDGDARKSAIDNLRAAGIATIIASGNSGSVNGISAPACISSAISVGATDDYDNVGWFSNVASILDLLAPGVSIRSSVPGGTSVSNGTSMAAPHVAGAWAIIRGFAPNATVAEILTMFTNTGTLVNDNRSSGTITGMRRINVDQAISLLDPPTAVDDMTTTPLDTAVVINVLSNDSDPTNDSLTLLANVGTPRHGTAVKISNTNIEYTPDPGYSGLDSFAYAISDGSNEDTATVTIIVDGRSAFLPVVVKN